MNGASISVMKRFDIDGIDLGPCLLTILENAGSPYVVVISNGNGIWTKSL